MKIKIPKDKIKTESITELTQQSLAPPPQPTIGIKLKIPKEKLNNCISLELNTKKRERDRSSPVEPQPAKLAKMSHKESKQNGRHSYTKVSNSRTAPISHNPLRFPYSSQTIHYMPPPPHPQSSGIQSLIPVDTMIPPPPTNHQMYIYPVPPPTAPSLPNMSIPPPNLLYPYYTNYYHPEFYTPPLLQPTKNVNPPLPPEAPPSYAPPPPPPE